jgi:Signal peptide peptidase
LILVTAILYAACHGSLVLLDHSDGESEVEMLADGSTHSTASSTASSNRETLRREDALQFPIIGSISLFSLYLCFKFLDKDLVNLIIGGYFGLVGCLAMTMTFAPAVAAIFLSKSSNQQYSWQYKIHHRLPEWICGPSPLDLGQEMTVAEIIALVLSAVVCGFYVYYKPWYLNNVIGICFCLQGIERFSLGTFKIGAILLIGLFFYDIFWVRVVFRSFFFKPRCCRLSVARINEIFDSFARRLLLIRTAAALSVVAFSSHLSLYFLFASSTVMLSDTTPNTIIFRFLAQKSW